MSVATLSAFSHPQSNCPICWEDDKEISWVIHSGENGKQHPFHKICLEQSLKVIPTCPSCRVLIQDPFFLQRRALKVINEHSTKIFLTASLSIVISTVFLKAIPVYKRSPTFEEMMTEKCFFSREPGDSWYILIPVLFHVLFIPSACIVESAIYRLSKATNFLHLYKV